MSDPLDLGVASSKEEAAERIKDAYKSFLRAGGRFSWGDWAVMGVVSRSAAEAAGAELARERARFVAEEAAALQIEREHSAAAEQIFDEVIETGVLG